MYSITVRIDGIEKRRRNAGLLHVVIGFFMIINIATYYRYTGYGSFFPLIPLLLVASISLFYGLFRRKLDWNAKYNFWLRLIQVISFIILGIAMTTVGRSLDYIGIFIFALLSIMLLFSEKRVFQETLLQISDKGIIIPGIYKDHHVEWTELSNVVVREDFITIFHEEQKYLQYQVNEDLSTLEVAKLNAFCKERIEGVARVEKDSNEQEAGSNG
jgi:hypothetical protein